MIDTDPFAPLPPAPGHASPSENPTVPAHALTSPVPGVDEDDFLDGAYLRHPNTFQLVDRKGYVFLCKKESGVTVRLKQLGHIKDVAHRALHNAATMTMRDAQTLTAEEMAEMSHVEVAALGLARAAALGDPDAITSLFDRLCGKPKQSSESVNVNVTIDDLLTSDNPPPKRVISVQHQANIPNE